MNYQTKCMNNILQKIQDSYKQNNIAAYVTLPEYISSNLLHDHVIFLPLKVGDIVYINAQYWTREKNAKENLIPFQITSYSISCNKNGIRTMKYRANLLSNGKTTRSTVDFGFDEIGETIFRAEDLTV